LTRFTSVTLALVKLKALLGRGLDDNEACNVYDFAAKLVTTLDQQTLQT